MPVTSLPIDEVLRILSKPTPKLPVVCTECGNHQDVTVNFADYTNIGKQIADTYCAQCVKKTMKAASEL